MARLILTLHRHWFDMIQSGEKKEEYRVMSKYWNSRLADEVAKFELQGDWRKGEPVKYRIGRYDEVEFRNGYRKDSPRMVFKINDIRIDTGKPEWGATQGELYYVIDLGPKVSETIRKS